MNGTDIVFMAEPEFITCPIDDCDWFGADILLHFHFKENHKENLVYDDCFTLYPDNVLGEIQCLVRLNKKNFLVTTYTSLSNKNKSKQIIISVHLIGRKRDALDYECCIETVRHGVKTREQFPWQPIISPPFRCTFQKDDKIIITQCDVNLRLSSKTELAQIAKFHANFSSFLKCSRCSKTMIPPIHQCLNGHLMCNDCKSNSRKRKYQPCPLCTSTIFARNLLAETYAESRVFHCKYKSMGCVLFSSRKMLVEHENQCTYKEVKCFGKLCEWKGKIEDLYAHARDGHENMAIAKGASLLRLDKCNAEDRHFVLYFNGVTFAVLVELKKENVYFTVRLLGPCVNDDGFFNYTLTIASKDNANIHKTTGKCVDYVTDEKYVKCCVQYPFNLIYNFVNGNCEINFTIDVFERKPQ